MTLCSDPLPSSASLKLADWGDGEREGGREQWGQQKARDSSVSVSSCVCTVQLWACSES